MERDTVLLEPLDAAETEQLLAELGGVPDELRERIVQVAEGNPLFLEEMLALVPRLGASEVEVPPTMQALLAARLDQLDPAERSVLERGSVEGEVLPPRRGAGARPTATAGRPAARRSRAQGARAPRPARLPGEDAYRFRHLLIRDAAYDALPKAARADLHRRFAAWLAEHGADLVELDEILGYHLEQAARYLAELGRPDLGLAEAAAERLAAAGERARWRGDERGGALAAATRAEAHRPHGSMSTWKLRFAMSHVATDARSACSRRQPTARRARATRRRGACPRACGADAAVAGRGIHRGSGGARPGGAAAARSGRDHAGLAQMWFALAYGADNYALPLRQIGHAAREGAPHATLAGRPPDRSDDLRRARSCSGRVRLARCCERSRCARLDARAST